MPSQRRNQVYDQSSIGNKSLLLAALAGASLVLQMLWAQPVIGQVAGTANNAESSRELNAQPTRRASAPDAVVTATKIDDIRSLRAWLTAGGDPNALDSEGQPLAILALREGSMQCFDALASHKGFRPDTANLQGETAIMYAALKGLLDVAKRLRSLGAEVNRAGWTPLHYAATMNQREFVKWLIDESAYIDAESPNGTTPLMMAARSKHRETIIVLIQEGADPTYKNQAGLTAAHYAERAQDDELAAWLRRREAEFISRHQLPPTRGSGPLPAAPR